MQMIHRLTERDLKMLTTDRNVPEALRVVARKLMTKSRTGH
jgi:ABC-type lipopolysaccharide export system ATPase subunit